MYTRARSQAVTCFCKPGDTSAYGQPPKLELTSVVAFLAGLFWLQKGQNPTIADAINLRGLLFFEMMFLSIRSMIGALLTFSSVFKMVVKERASGMYHLSAFFFARMASDLPVDSTLPTIFILIIYFMAGLR